MHSISAPLQSMEKLTIQVEVAYATPDQQKIFSLEVYEGATVEQAILQSNVLETFSGIQLTVNKVGIFGQIVNLNTVLQEGDRVEIYRPLVIDPRLARKQRVQKSR